MSMAKELANKSDCTNLFKITMFFIKGFSVSILSWIIFLQFCRMIYCIFESCDKLFFSDENPLFKIIDFLVKINSFKHVAMSFASDYGFIGVVVPFFLASVLIILICSWMVIICLGRIDIIDRYVSVVSILMPIWLFGAMIYRGASPLNIPKYGTEIQKQSMKYCLSFYSSDEITITSFPKIMANCEDNAVKKRKWAEEAQQKAEEKAAENAKVAEQAKQTESLRKTLREMKLDL